MDNKKIYRRKNRKNTSSKITALSEAQKLVFAPFTFQVIGSLIDLEILPYLEQPHSYDEILKKFNVSDYCLRVLFQAAKFANIIKENDDGNILLTNLGACFISDEMTINNFNFMRDVCYLGASEMTESLKKGEPVGLQKFMKNAKTIYPHVPYLEDKVKKSWYDFDHYYSATCFDEILPIIFKDNPSKIFDIGGNTGKFEKACLEFNDSCKLTMIDLPVNETAAKQYIKNPSRFEFISCDVLSDETFPKLSQVVFMSQFLDCFSFEQVIKILTKIRTSADIGTKVYILEPIIDNQNFDGAKLSLAHISLYFTCMANGNSKMFLFDEIKNIIENSGLKILNIHNNIGIHDYTLLECEVE